MMLNDSGSKDQHLLQVLKNRVHSCLSYFLKQSLVLLLDNEKM